MKTKVRAGLAFGVVVAAVVFLAASGESNEAKKTDDASASSSTADGSSTGAGGEGDGVETFVVGDVVELGDWTVQVHEVIDPLESSNDFLGPDDGERWVAVDAEVTNLGGDVETVSSMMCFDLQDGSNRSYNITITGENLPSLDGEAAAGAARRGTLVYAVPADATGLRLNFKCDVFSSGSATIELG